jgi:hypothetical protein
MESVISGKKTAPLGAHQGRVSEQKQRHNVLLVNLFILRDDETRAAMSVNFLFNDKRLSLVTSPHADCATLLRFIVDQFALFITQWQQITQEIDPFTLFISRGEITQGCSYV